MNATARKTSPDFSKYVGRTYEETNCWELVREFYADQFGVALSQYYEQGKIDRSSVESLISSNKGSFIKVDAPSFGDIITIKIFGVECHVGVYIGDHRFLHSANKIGSCIERIEKYKHLITGFYRHD